jgi:mRNA interferase MazF
MSKPIRTYDRYEVVKVPFPFIDSNRAKVRPALILSSAKGYNAKIGISVMAMITSVKQHQERWPGDILIEDLEVTKLTAPSIIRFKIFSLDHRLILSRLGKLGPSDQVRVQKRLKEIFLLF